MTALFEKLFFFPKWADNLCDQINESATQLKKQINSSQSFKTVLWTIDELIYWKEPTQKNESDTTISVWIINDSVFTSLPFCELNELIHWKNSNSKE